MPISPSKRDRFAKLFNEFLPTYPPSTSGKKHRELYISARKQAEENYQAIASAVAHGDDFTDLVILKWLPYADTDNNRAKGAWIHWAPSINGDIRKWYENAGWVSPTEWPNVARAIWSFVSKCVNDPNSYELACQEFAATVTRGFQTGTLTPILNALVPEKFSLINNKSRNTINYLTDANYGPNLADYSAINVKVFEVVDELGDYLHASTLDIAPCDLFDMFCHWLVAERKFTFQNSNFWKIAPGEKAWAWEEWRDGGYISVGWEEFGDLTKLDRHAFEQQRTKLIAEHGWTNEGVEQVWIFAKDIREGDQIVANRGTKELLGIGIVSGPYYFVPDQRHGHRFPVEWIDTTPRKINQGGWRKTLIQLSQEKFDELKGAPEYTKLPLATPFNQIFADRNEAEWAFDFLKQSMELLGVTGLDDRRVSLTLPKNHKRNLLRFNFTNAVVVDFKGNKIKGGRGVNLALLEDDPIKSLLKDYPRWGTFKTFGTPVTVFELPFAVVRDMTPELAKYYEQTFRQLGEAKKDFGGGPFYHAHQKAIMEAVFDLERREELFDRGLPLIDNRAGGIHSNAAFSEATFELLEELHNRPKAEVYLDSKTAFHNEVEAPFQRVMERVAAQFPLAILSVMETQKNLFGRILKNDFGQGGAWPYYWGAFYPKGSKRSQDAQLIVWMDYQRLQFGFYIGEYGSQQRQRFLHNCQLYQTQLATILEMLAADQFIYGSASDDLLANGESPMRPNATAQDWRDFLENPEKYNCDIAVVLPSDTVLQLSEDELVKRIASAHKQLFPLILLCTSEDPLSAIADYLELDPPGGEEPDDIAPRFTLEDCAGETGYDLATLTEWYTAIQHKKQAVLYGPPGTGKTYLAERLARVLCSESDGFVELVQFHPAYAYEDFIQGIRPQTTPDGKLVYQTMPGRFLEFCQQAERRSGACILIIDEINRANLARVFGELMYLMEYRDRTIPLAGGGTLRIPQNVRIIGTMNTADRSIALVDHALRRRFVFIALPPNLQRLRDYHQAPEDQPYINNLIRVLERLNQRIQDRNYAVGTSYFLRRDLRQALPAVWRLEIEPYLEEYFFAQSDRLEEFRWQKISTEIGG